eukprot:6808849-Karenia_brevis.AAC.1
MATKRSCDQAWPHASEEEGLDEDVLGSASSSSAEEQVREVTSEEDEEGWKRPKRGEGVTGVGRPLAAEVFGKERAFHDGNGFCSPG